MALCESTISLLNPNLIWDVAHFARLNLPHARKIRDFMRSRQCRRNAPWRAPCCSSKLARNDQNNQAINQSMGWFHVISWWVSVFVPFISRILWGSIMYVFFSLHRKSGNPFLNIERETSILKLLTHPNIVKLFEILNDPEEDLSYFVFE